MSIKIENRISPSAEQWKTIILGSRNAMNSWNKSDSKIQYESFHDMSGGDFVIGPNDFDLMLRLRDAGTDHRKFMRMITVYVTITAPLYWWKEYDTYKIGTVANSCSTMHKIHDKEFTLDDFSCEHLNTMSLTILNTIITNLNYDRGTYLVTKDKNDWWQMIQLLPSSYNQKRTVMLNYEVLANMYRSRKSHKLDEWRELCKWFETLPYSELITGKENNND